MNVTVLNSAMQYIDDQYLDLADTPQKEIIQMLKRKTITRICLIAALIAMLAVTAYAADFLAVKSFISGTKTIYEAFPEIKEAMEEAGFQMDAKEFFRTGYAFQNVNVQEIRGEDESDQEVLSYSSIVVFYQNAAGNHLVLAAEPEMPGITDADHPAVQTREIGAVTAKYFEDHYKFVPEDYEPTEEEMKWMEQPGNFISYGSDEIEETKVSYLAWTKDGIRYSLMDIRAAEQPEVMFSIAEELILG